MGDDPPSPPQRKAGPGGGLSVIVEEVEAVAEQSPHGLAPRHPGVAAGGASHRSGEQAPPPSRRGAETPGKEPLEGGG